MTPLRRIVQIRDGGRTERCHGIRHIGEYSVAAHSWGVAMLMLVLWPEDFPRLAATCLTHDVPEAWVGDIPAPTKRYAEGMKDCSNGLEGLIFDALGLAKDTDLPPEDKVKLKNCDQVELYLWSAEQRLMGNQLALEVMRELEQFWVETPLLPAAAALITDIRLFGVAPFKSGVIKSLVENGVHP